MQEKKKEVNYNKHGRSRPARSSFEADVEIANAQIQAVEGLLDMIPAEVISRRAVECRSFARALFHWEQFIRQQKNITSMQSEKPSLEPLYERLQDIYTQIDEPDGIEGISANLQILNIDQQVLEHRKAGRWAAAQSWYELQLHERPNDINVQSDLLTSLKESGQHGKHLSDSDTSKLMRAGVLVNQIEGLQQSKATAALCLPFAVESCWVTGNWIKLRKYINSLGGSTVGDFNIGIGSVLLALLDGHDDIFLEKLETLRRNLAKSLSTTNTMSLQVCHDVMLRLHVLTEVELISGVGPAKEIDLPTLMTILGPRLSVLGAFLPEKQYLLGLRRAALQLTRFE